MSRWMEKKNIDRYEEKIRVYLEEKGSILSFVKFDWGFQVSVELKDDGEFAAFAFEYQGDDQFSVKKTTSDWDEEDYLRDHTERLGFITLN